MHANSGYADEALALARRFVRVFGRSRRSSRRPRRASAMVREPLPGGRPDRRVRADRVPRRPAGRRGRRRVVPAPRHATPDLPLAAAAAGRRPPAAAAARRCAGIDLVDLPEEPQECCGFGGTFAVKNADTSMAMLSDKLRRDPRHARRGLHGGRQLVPDAHRRRAAPAARRRARDAPRRDPGGARVNGGFPAAAREALRDAQLRRNLGKATQTIRAKRLRPSPSSPTGRRCATRARRSRRARWRRCPSSSSASRRRSPRAGGTVHWARDGGGGERDRRRHRPRRTARDEVIKVKSLATDEIGLNEALARARDRGDRDRPRRADHPARRRHAVAHPRARRSTATGPRSARCSSARSRRARSSAGRPTALAEAARRHLREKFLSVPVGGLRRELRGRRDRHDRRRRVRGQRAHVHDAAARRWSP